MSSLFINRLFRETSHLHGFSGNPHRALDREPRRGEPRRGARRRQTPGSTSSWRTGRWRAWTARGSTQNSRMPRRRRLGFDIATLILLGVVPEGPALRRDDRCRNGAAGGDQGDRPALAGDPGRAAAGRPRGSRTGALLPALACAEPFLRTLRRAAPAASRRRQPHLRDMPDRDVPACRPGRHHAGGRGRAAACSAGSRALRRACIRRWPASWSRARRSRTR